MGLVGLNLTTELGKYKLNTASKKLESVELLLRDLSRKLSNVIYCITVILQKKITSMLYDLDAAKYEYELFVNYIVRGNIVRSRSNLYGEKNSKNKFRSSYHSPAPRFQWKNNG